MSAIVHHGDALTVLPTLADPVDMVLTDPPYNSGGRTTQERITTSSRSKYVSSGATHTLPEFQGDNRDQRSYGWWLSLILAECLRLARDESTCCVFTDWRQMPTTADALQAAGWTWRGVLTWHKPVSRPQKGRFKQDCEFVVWGSKGQLPPRELRQPIYLPGLYSASQPSATKRVHITQKPVDVLRKLIQISPENGTILDPFAGSGSTGVAALMERRRFVGIEHSAHYATVTQQRLAETHAELSAASR